MLVNCIELTRGSVIETAVRTLLVVMSSPGFNDHSSLSQILEPFDIQTLISQAPVEAFSKGILPRTTWINVEGLDAFLFEPF